MDIQGIMEQIKQAHTYLTRKQLLGKRRLTKKDMDALITLLGQTYLVIGFLCSKIEKQI